LLAFLQLAKVASMHEADPSATEVRVLRRSTEDKIIFGVCGGLGRYLGVEPILLRVAFVILTIAGGSGVLIYLVAWLVIPKERAGEHVGTTHGTSGATGSVLAGTALIALGTILLIDRFVSWFDKVIGPVTLIALGVAVRVWGARR
jgi:phage shock protein C